MSTDPEPGAARAAGSRRQAPRPLAGVRVIAVEQYGAGPFGTLYLADLGAEIIKVEDPGSGGDVSRYIPPGRVGTDSLFFEAFNRGKRSIALDLKSTAGRAVFERLVASADAVFSNLRGDQPDRLGLTYDVLGRINPAIVCVALTGYGRRGDQAPPPRLRRAHPGRIRLGRAHRCAGRPADQERPLARRLHRRVDRRPGPDGRPLRRPPDRPRARR